MAVRYLSEVRTIQPRGPYFLGAYSWGSRVAYEMAQQLLASGEEVALLALFDSGGIATKWQTRGEKARRWAFVTSRAARALLSFDFSARNRFFSAQRSRKAT